MVHVSKTMYFFCWAPMHHIYIDTYRSNVSCLLPRRAWISCYTCTLCIYIQNDKYSLYMAITISIVCWENISTKLNKYIVDGSICLFFTIVFVLLLSPVCSKIESELDDIKRPLHNALYYGQFYFMNGCFCESAIFTGTINSSK